jgi:hypothetical protein
VLASPHGLWSWVAGLSAFAVAAAAAMQSAAGVSAQSEPPPTPRTPPCIGMPNMAELSVDSSLSLKDVRAGSSLATYTRLDGQVATAEVIEVSWIGAAGAKCTWIAVRVPGERSYPLGAEFVLPPDKTELRYEPTDFVGEYCLQIFQLSEGRRSEAREVCLVISEPKLTVFSMAPNPDMDGRSSSEFAEYGVGAAAGIATGLVLAAALSFAVRRSSPAD